MEKINKIKESYSWNGLLFFALPSIFLQLWLAMYQEISSAISSSFISTDALAAIDVCYPIISIEEAIGAMLGAGACAVISKKMGEGKKEEACSNLSTVVVLDIAIMIVYLVVINIIKEPLLRLIGATDILMPYCLDFMEIHVWVGVFYSVQILYQFLLVLGGKPGAGLVVSVVSGISEVTAVYFFVAVLGLGIKGSFNRLYDRRK